MVCWFQLRSGPYTLNDYRFPETDFLLHCLGRCVAGTASYGGSMKQLCWIALSCLVLIYANPVRAQDSIYLGNVHVMPSIAYQTEYNDNIYLSHTDENEDFIHTVTPGIQLEYRTGEQRYIRTG